MKGTVFVAISRAADCQGTNVRFRKGAVIIGIVFGAHYTIVIIRNPQNGIGNYKAIAGAVAIRRAVFRLEQAGTEP